MKKQSLAAGTITNTKILSNLKYNSYALSQIFVCQGKCLLKLFSYKTDYTAFDFFLLYCKKSLQIPAAILMSGGNSLVISSLLQSL